MSRKHPVDKRKNGIRCQRCDGPMMLEKFYGENDSFYGWHCLICGAILDPVILLHHLSQDAKLVIPETEEDILLLIKKLMTRKAKKIGTPNAQNCGDSDGDLSANH